MSNELKEAASLATRQELVVVLLTFNSQDTIRKTVAAARKLGCPIYAVDSWSSDQTVSILRELDCRVFERTFANYADQRNWIIKAAELEFRWQFHLDADEVLDDLAIQEILHILSAKVDRDAAYIFRRKTYFMGKPLRFGGTSSDHLRLFRSGTTYCENRLYDQHFLSKSPSIRLRGTLHDRNVGTLHEWVQRHNRWSDLEAAELAKKTPDLAGQLPARISMDSRERRRLYKRLYYSTPTGIRAIALFVLRYVVLGGFLDGSVGFYYAFFQVAWFRTLVDAKCWEFAQVKNNSDRTS